MEPLYIPVYKDKEYKPVTWSVMLNLRSILKNMKWRIKI